MVVKFKLLYRASAHQITIILFAAVAFAWTAGAKAEIVLKDAVGRQVHLTNPASRIVTNESLLLLELALIDRDPVSKLAGWASPQRLDRGIYRSFEDRFPKINAVPTVGGVVPANTSVESLLSAQPDLFVVSIWDRGWEEIAARLQAVGVPTIFLDAPGRGPDNPVEALSFSVNLLGQAIGRRAEAANYSDFLRSRYREIADRLRPVPDRPLVLVDAFAGTECCSVPGRSNRLADYIDAAKATSLGSDTIPGYQGRINPEAVIDAEPDVYIGTGGSQLASQGGLVLGGNVREEDARASLRSVLSKGIRQNIQAARHGRAYGISHQLSISALSILALECFAKWAHPTLLSDLDPARTLAEINNRFLAVPIEGTFWISLEEQN